MLRLRILPLLCVTLTACSGATTAGGGVSLSVLSGSLDIQIRGEPGALRLEGRFLEQDRRPTVAVVAVGSNERLEKCVLRLTANGRMLAVDDAGHMQVARRVDGKLIRAEALSVSVPMKDVQHLAKAALLEVGVCLEVYTLDASQLTAVRAFAEDALRRR